MNSLYYTLLGRKTLTKTLRIEYGQLGLKFVLRMIEGTDWQEGRKTKSSVIYDRTKNVDAVRRLLGQSSVTATSAYIGVTDNSALELARNINV